MHEELSQRQYLGDGVYVGHDGWHIVLWLESMGAYGPNAVALEPAVLSALQQYVDTISDESYRIVEAARSVATARRLESESDE